MAYASSQVPGPSGIQSNEVNNVNRTVEIIPPKLEDDKITFFYPISEVIPCCKCNDSFKNADHNILKNSYLRHLRDTHKVIPSTKCNICIFCKLDISRNMKGHRCFANGMCVVPSDAGCNYKCKKCGKAFPNFRGLSNHEKTHKAREVQDAFDRRKRKAAQNDRTEPVVPNNDVDLTHPHVFTEIAGASRLSFAGVDDSQVSDNVRPAFVTSSNGYVDMRVMQGTSSSAGDETGNLRDELIAAVGHDAEQMSSDVGLLNVSADEGILTYTNDFNSPPPPLQEVGEMFVSVSNSGFNNSIVHSIPVIQDRVEGLVLTTVDNFNSSVNDISGNVPGMQESSAHAPLVTNVDHAERDDVGEGVSGYDPYTRGGGTPVAQNNVANVDNVSVVGDDHVSGDQSSIESQDSVAPSLNGEGTTSFMFDDGIVEAVELLDNNDLDVDVNEGIPVEIQPELDIVSKYSPIFRDMLNNENRSFEAFVAAVGDFTREVKNHLGLRERKDASGRPPRKIDVENPKKLQKLYKLNRRKALRLIYGDESEFCGLDPDRVADHFDVEGMAEPIDLLHKKFYKKAATPTNCNPFSRSEVRNRLRSCENSSPGPDGISYKGWKSIDPDAVVLADIFNLCLIFKRVPVNWKITTTILIFKKGDKTDPGNWRPISLGNTLYKLYSGCLAKRLSKWITDCDVLCFNQKGFLPYDGVFENNFALDFYIRRAKIKKKDMCLASLDISNAFGSLPHWALFLALKESGAGEAFIDVVKD